ncbi:MAG: insulinase family protein [Phycisphaerae bacterium]|nr:insulinase family protein [Phycisphaerae bacterium]
MSDAIQTYLPANGMRVVIEPIAGVRSAAVTWLVPGGGAYDPADRLGRAAMWSELLLRGAGDLDSRAQADAFDRLGAHRSADAGGLYMRLGMTCLGTRLVEALPRLADMARRPRMEASAIEPARELALAAIEALRDEPMERAVLAARARHLPEPLGRSSLGTPEGLAALTRDELVSGWRGVALPNGAAGLGGSILAIAGAADPDALRRAIDDTLGDWAGERPEPVVARTAPGGYAHEPDKTNQVQIVVMHEAPPEGHADSLLEKVAMSVLSGTMSGRLFTEVREKRGLCYSVHARYAGDRDFGMVMADVGTTPEKAQQSLDVLMGELTRLNTPAGAVTPDEFRRAIVGMKSRVVFAGESTAARASGMASDVHRLGRARTLDEIVEAVDAVTLDRVNDYLARRRLGRVTIQSLGPVELRPPAP